jgi:hypothetical protein
MSDSVARPCTDRRKQIRKLGNPCQDTGDVELRPGAKAKVYATFRPQWRSDLHDLRQFCSTLPGAVWNAVPPGPEK